LPSVQPATAPRCEPWPASDRGAGLLSDLELDWPLGLLLDDVARSRTRSPAQTSSTRNRTRSQPLSLLSIARLKRTRWRARCFSCSRTRTPKRPSV
jgi:hypothetical protein